MTVVLPTPESNPGKAEWSEVYANDKALKEAVEALESKTSSVTWYTPKVIATEQTRESASFGTLTTPDEIKEVKLPENGLIAIAYLAIAKCSTAGSGRAAIFIGSNQLKKPGSSVPVVQEAELFGTGTFQTVATAADGLDRGEGTSFVSTGQVVAHNRGTGFGGFCYVFASAGTYNISVQYRATAGSITAKERKLWVATLGA
jgi:hypothetical protein